MRKRSIRLSIAVISIAVAVGILLSPYAAAADFNFGNDEFLCSSGNNILSDAITGNAFKAIHSGTVNSITAWLVSGGSGGPYPDLKYAIYEFTDETTLLGSTDEFSLTGDINYWKKLDLLAPVEITADTNYILVAWANGGPPDKFVGICTYLSDPLILTAVVESSVFNGWPDDNSVWPTSYSAFVIYATYDYSPPPINYTPDANLLKIGGYDLNGAIPVFTSKSQQTVLFSVQDPNNDRLFFDLNFGTAGQGTGTALYSDQNLTAAYCADQNFQHTSNCSITWDLNSVPDGNHYLTLTVHDGNTSSFEASVSTVGVANPDINNLKLYEYLIYSKVIDLNIGTDANLVFDFNAETRFDINTAGTKIFYHVTGSDDGNCFGWERTVQKCGWKVEDATEISWNIFKQVDGNYLFRSETEDNHAYKPYAYNTDPENFEVTDGTYILSTGDRWARTLLTFVPRDVNTLYNISFSGSYTGTLSRTLNVYDCNTAVSDPLTSRLCNRFSFTSASKKASDGYFIIKQVSNDFNQLVADYNVTMNADGNHWIYFNCPNCSPAKYWSIDNIAENTNVDRTRNWTSTAGPAEFVASTNTFDAHMHWLKLNNANYFDFIIQLQDQAGGDHNSQMYRDLISAVNLRPRVSSVYYPVPGNYVKGVIDVNISVVDPYINPIADGVVCDVNILDVNKVPIHSLMFNQAVIICPFCAGYHCVGSFDTETVADGNYFIYVKVRETNTSNLYSNDFNTGSPFIVDNTEPSFILVTPTIETLVYNGLVEFLIFGADAGSKLATCTYSIFEDDILDTNSYAIADSNGQCTVSFFGLPGTEVYLTVLKLTDNIGNILSQLEVSEKYIIRELVPAYEADAENITDEDLGNIFLYTIYSFIIGASLSFFWVIGLILTVMALIIILKRGG